MINSIEVELKRNVNKIAKVIKQLIKDKRSIEEIRKEVVTMFKLVAMARRALENPKRLKGFDKKWINILFDNCTGIQFDPGLLPAPRREELLIRLRQFVKDVGVTNSWGEILDISHSVLLEDNPMTIDRIRNIFSLYWILGRLPLKQAKISIKTKESEELLGSLTSTDGFWVNFIING